MKEPQLPISDLPSLPQTPKLRFLVIGAGSRGNAYARAVTTITSATALIHAVAEPHAFKRREFGARYIWGEKGPATGQEFDDWREWVRWEIERRHKSPGTPGVDGVFICTLDETHMEILTALAPLGLHILCEKPLAVSLDDCLHIYRTLSTSPNQAKKIFSIGHVLRYSPHNILLRNLLLVDRVVGDIVSLEHTEPVGWWHFAHSYVRGNWRRATPAGDGSLLTKSCHDVDFILWLLCSPPEADNPDREVRRPHLPRSITSTGHLTQFHRARKPPAATATNCLSCPIERECMYSAVRIYRDMHLLRGERGWPVSVVVADIEDAGTSTDAAETMLLRRLGEDYSKEMTDAEIKERPWYGRCVYDADNDVCDDQVVTITWDDDDDGAGGDGGNRRNAKSAIFHMIAPTEKQCERRGRVYGTRGELVYDSRSISVYDFATGETRTVEVPSPLPGEKDAHGGGDYGLVRAFVSAVDAVENRGWGVDRAQARFVGCTLEEAVRSHAVVFAAEEARREEKVVRWKSWWEEKLAAAGILPLSRT